VTPSEILRRLNNIVSIGSIIESKSVDGLALARVKIGERVTDFFPMLQQSSSFKRSARPIRVGEQVMVLSPFGDGDFGVILGSLFNKSAKEPDGSSDVREVFEYEDGTKIYYDTKTKTLSVDAVGTVNIICKKATVTADSAEINAPTTINGNLSVTGEVSAGGSIKTGGTVTDAKGNLSNFTTTDGSGRA